MATTKKFLGKPRRYWYDLVERVAGTFAAGFVAEWLLTDQSLDWQTIKVAAAAAAVTTVKSLLGGFVGNKGTAGLLPKEDDPATPPPVPPGD